jgi:hypothetical protein
MSWDGAAVFEAIVSTIQTIDRVNVVIRGVPLTLPNEASVYVARGGTEPIDRRMTGGVRRRTIKFLVVFGYQTKGNIPAAEAQIIQWADAFEAKFERDPRLGLSDTVIVAATLDGQLADTPNYQSFASVEFRLLPYTLHVTQDMNTEIT